MKGQPLRTCIVTKEKLPKKELIRLVRVKDENVPGGFRVEVDLRNKKNGRGANIKPDPLLLDQALEKGILVRALQLGRQLSPTEKLQLQKDFSEALAEKHFRPNNKPVKIKVTKKEYLEKLAS